MHFCLPIADNKITVFPYILLFIWSTIKPKRSFQEVKLPVQQYFPFRLLCNDLANNDRSISKYPCNEENTHVPEKREVVQQIFCNCFSKAVIELLCICETGHNTHHYNVCVNLKSIWQLLSRAQNGNFDLFIHLANQKETPFDFKQILCI